MKVKGKVLHLGTGAHGIVVKVLCRFPRQPTWQGAHEIEFVVPAHTAKNYFIGKDVTVTVSG